MTKSLVLKKTSKIASILFFGICMALCISCADLFSSLITVGGFSNITSGEIKQSEYKIYAISLFETDTKIQAKEMSDVTKRKNGAGFIWQGKTKYYVFASCYENKADAEKVQLNLTENHTSCTVVELVFSEIVIKAEVNDQEKTALTSAVQIYKNMYKKLYDLSVSIDTNLYTEIESKVLLSDIISDFTKTKTNFESLFNSKLTSDLLELKLSLSNVSSILNSLSEFSSNEIPYTSQVKNTYFQILNEYNNLSKTL